MNESREINILGVRIDKINHSDLMILVENSLVNKKRTKIFTPNTNMIATANKNENLKALLNRADISIADGIGVVLASKIIGTPLPMRLAGIEIGEDILEIAARKNYRIYLLGSTNDILKKAKSNLESKYKSLKICGTHHGYFDVNSTENERVIESINKSNADIIFVCMGFPRQEEWIDNNAQKLSTVMLSIGLGGSIDVWSGKIKRAPKILRLICLEWLWRILIETKRAKFLTAIPYFLKEVLKQRQIFIKNNGKNAHI